MYLVYVSNFFVCNIFTQFCVIANRYIVNLFSCSPIPSVPGWKVRFVFISRAEVCVSAYHFIFNASFTKHFSLPDCKVLERVHLPITVLLCLFLVNCPSLSVRHILIYLVYSQCVFQYRPIIFACFQYHHCCLVHNCS